MQDIVVKLTGAGTTVEAVLALVMLQLLPGERF